MIQKEKIAKAILTSSQIVYVQWFPPPPEINTVHQTRFIAKDEAKERPFLTIFLAFDWEYQYCKRGNYCLIDSPAGFLM